MNELCRGCLTFSEYDYCTYMVIENCPCQNCLVKVMCNEKCEELEYSHANPTGLALQQKGEKMSNTLILIGIFVGMSLVDFFLYCLMYYSGGYKPKNGFPPLSILEYVTKYRRWKKSDDHNYPSL